ncbi:MAG: alpha/beta fold hydrolase [Pseudomonadota bacterium]
MSDGQPIIAEHRIAGPTPLPLHLALAGHALQQGVALAPLAEHYGLSESAPMQGAVLISALEQLSSMFNGIETWRRAPYRRSVERPPAIWSEGSSHLLDYGATPEAANPNGPPILVIPSMINRAYVLDLMPETSLLRSLAAAGYRPLLLDWGQPTPREQELTLEDMIAARLRPALAIARVLGGGPVPVLGYCMGGTLAAALAANAAQDVRAVITIGTPWDFEKRIWVTERIADALKPDGGLSLRYSLRGMGFALGAIPDVVFQSLFAQLDPTGTLRKFARFSEGCDTETDAKHFVAVEDWLNDGPPVPTSIAETVLVDWHLLNTTGSGLWSALGRRVDPAAISQPSLCFCSPNDRIAPPGSAEALAGLIPNAEVLRPNLGHVGMVVSRRSKASVVDPIIGFLKKL